MMNRRTLKMLALVFTMALCLALTGCYIPPDEIDTNTNNLTLGSDTLPFETVAPTQAPTSVPVATSAAPDATVNWDDWGGATNTPGAASTDNGGVIATGLPTATPTLKLTTATPTATVGVLKHGATGTAVRQMQQRLKDLGYLKGSADGDFGDATLNALIAFQAANKLTADGVAGTRTLEKLYSNNAIPASQAAKTPTPTPKPTATPAYNENTYLREGNSGAKVRQLQERLIALGWLAGSPDGEFGGATEAAVKAFQAREGLWDDGVAGPDTLKELYSNGAARTSNPVAIVVGSSLREGSEGSVVRMVQQRLKKLGYYSGSVDGSYGTGTSAAVKAFQKNNGLTADGIAGRGTIDRLFSDDAFSASEGAASDDDGKNNSNIGSTGYVSLREGDEGEAVRKLQQKLKSLGYYSGTVDGKYGAGTVTAVKTFQRMNNLTVDGVAGPATQRAVYGTNSSISYATLREGDEGTGVTNLQYTLYELGYYDGKIDGKYGATTKDAVRAFQIENGLRPVDGIAGNKTQQRLYSSKAIPATAPKTEFETLRKGDKGDRVVQLQETLKSLGYWSGDITGVYDDQTFSSIKTFQQYNGLTADGVAGSATQAALYGDHPVKYPH